MASVSEIKKKKMASVSEIRKKKLAALLEMRKKKIPTSVKFGFIGLGIMGSRIVKNFLKSGHSVIVWNRTPDKCQELVKAGAVQGQTPADVIREADITFSCVSGPSATKEVVYGVSGVLHEMNSSKGYVELTSLDAESSAEISHAIVTQGGRYLEAQIQGSKVEAEKGTLVIVAAGERSLYNDCQSCFEAMSISSFYLGGEVGDACKFNLVIQIIGGIAIAGLAEGMALADISGLKKEDVLEILKHTSLACPMITEKGEAMVNGRFPTHLPLQHMQKDLQLSLNMGDELGKALPLTAATNEVFKHAKRMDCGKKDVSSVYISTRLNRENFLKMSEEI